MIGIDTNVLVALAMRDHPHHEAVRAVLSRDLNALLVFTPAVMAEFVHTVTDPRRFRNPMTMQAAVADARARWTARNAVRLLPSDAAARLCFDWLDEFQLGRKRVLDTMLAAALYTAGIRRLFTLNTGDFKVFGVFELLVP